MTNTRGRAAKQTHTTRFSFPVFSFNRARATVVYSIQLKVPIYRHRIKDTNNQHAIYTEAILTTDKVASRIEVP